MRSTKDCIRQIGSCGDIGTTKFGIMLKTLGRIQSHLGWRNGSIKISEYGFKFQNVAYAPISFLRLLFYTPPDILTNYIVPEDVPALLSLDVLDEQQLVIGTYLYIQLNEHEFPVKMHQTFMAMTGASNWFTQRVRMRTPVKATMLIYICASPDSDYLDSRVNSITHMSIIFFNLFKN